MSQVVPADQIEKIVGVERHPNMHFGRAVSAEQVFYVLHSQACKDAGHDLRECAYSEALDEGIDLGVWAAYQDQAVPLGIQDWRLVPLASSQGEGE